jgi:hypothetical protein
MDLFARSAYAIFFLALAAMLANGGITAPDGSILVLILLIAVTQPYNVSRSRQLQRGKEILNRHSPGRNPKPLGL